MKCFSRSTLGVVIGAFNILCYIGVSIFMIGFISDNSSDNSNIQLDAVDKYYRNENIQLNRENAAAFRTIVYSTVLSVCLLMVIISGLLIMGIVKRRHQLMWPWLALSGLGFVCNAIRIVFSVILGLINGAGIALVLTMFIGGALGLGLHALILWPIYTLCRDITEKNNLKPGKLVENTNYSYTAPPDAPPQYTYEQCPLPQKA